MATNHNSLRAFLTTCVNLERLEVRATHDTFTREVIQDLTPQPSRFPGSTGTYLLPKIRSFKVFIECKGWNGDVHLGTVPEFVKARLDVVNRIEDV